MAKAAKDPSKVTHPPRLLAPKDQVVVEYHVIVPAGHTQANLFDPNYFCHSARRLKRHTELTVVAEDFSFYGKLLVVSSEANAVHVAVVSWTDIGTYDQEDTTAAYKVSQSASGFRVIHKSTGDVVKEGLATRAAALDHIANLAK